MDLTSQQNPSKENVSGSAGGGSKAPAQASGTTLAPPMATIQDDDERLLARIGYKQVYLYSFLFFSLLHISSFSLTLPRN